MTAYDRDEIDRLFAAIPADELRLDDCIIELAEMDWSEAPPLAELMAKAWTWLPAILAERADRYETDAAQLPEALRRMHAAEASVGRVRELCASELMLTPREVLAAIDGSEL